MRYSSYTDVHDDGLRRFVSNIFALMCVGLAITAGIAWWISHTPGMMESLFSLTKVIVDGKEKTEMHGSGMWWFVSAIELVIVFFMARGGAARSLSPGAALIMFLVYSAMNGYTMSPVLYAYTDASTVKVFAICAGTFGACAFFGHTTKINLRPLGSFLFIGLIGLLVALVVNIFYHSPAIDFAISAAAVLLFAILTAFDVQKLTDLYYEDPDPTLAIIGSLELYLDFVNMYLHLLRIFGVRKD